MMHAGMTPGGDPLHGREEKFRALLESASDGIVIVDARGQIVLVNGQAETMFDYRRDELLGQPVELLLPDALRTSHVAYRERYVAAPTTRPMGSGSISRVAGRTARPFPSRSA
jgi:PAS domain S-box-containing protein